MDRDIAQGFPLENNRGIVFSAVTVVVPAYIAAIALAEALRLFLGVVPGILCHALLIPLLLSHYVLMDQVPYRRVLPVLALAPLMRILSVSIPSEQVPPIYWYALAGTPLLIAIFLTIRLLDLSPASIGLRPQSWPLQLVIASTALPLSVAASLLLQPTPLFEVFTWPELVIDAAILIVFTGLTEEILFRGLLLQVAGEIFGPASVLLSNILFVIMYAGSPSPGYVLFAGLVGLLFGWFAWWTSSIWGTALAHGLLNVGLLLIIPHTAGQVLRLVDPADIPVLLTLALLMNVAICIFVAYAGRPPALASVPAPTNIRRLRRRAGLSHTELAQRSGIPARTIAEIEHGLRQPQPEHLHLIAQALDVAPQSLLPSEPGT